MKRHKVGKSRKHRPAPGLLTEYRKWLKRTSRTDNPGARGLFLKQRDQYMKGMNQRDKTLADIRAKIAENRRGGSETYAGLQSHEIGKYNRALMFGDNDEAFPGQDEWKRVTD